MKPFIESYEASGRVIDVVRDDLLAGGTKQAAIMAMLYSIPGDTIVYASPRQGYAQIAIAAACKATQRKAVLFVAASKQLHPRTAIAEKLGATVHQIPAGYLSVIQSRAKSYCAETGAALLPFGLSCPEMVNAIASRALWLRIDPPHEVWSVAGSGTLQRGLQQAWPSAKFYAVQIGKKPDAGIAKVIVAPEKYEQAAKDKPPFPSCDNYDAKAWQFIKQSASNGALFWNVAA